MVNYSMRDLIKNNKFITMYTSWSSTCLSWIPFYTESVYLSGFTLSKFLTSTSFYLSWGPGSVKFVAAAASGLLFMMTSSLWKSRMIVCLNSWAVKLKNTALIILLTLKWSKRIDLRVIWVMTIMGLKLTTIGWILTSYSNNRLKMII